MIRELNFDNGQLYSMSKSVYEIDGNHFTTLEEFFQEVGRVLVPEGWDWGKNLDAFNDILRGGFGTPDEGFILKWKNSDTSRTRLGYAETIRRLELRLQRCHPLNREYVSRDLEDARAGIGPTVFDWLVGIITSHGAGGDQQEDQVQLALE